MKRNEEDEIQVLGTPKRKQGPIRWRIMGCIFLLVVVLLLLLFTDRRDEKPDDESVDFFIAQNDSVSADLPGIAYQADSINDVVLSIYFLQDLNAELSLQMPNNADSSVFFVLQAADIRRDNGGIVGDFVLNGKQLFRGKRKTGYCAIIDGKISLGNTINDEIKDYCIAHRGDFFRQYPLVMDGEIQVNRLKGKAVRRALAQQNNDFYIVESKNRESLYDFSEALADMGFTYALYLVGGSSYGWWRDKDGAIRELGIYNKESLPNINYLVFKKSH